MSEQRTLVVTVGTSLFSSATWRCEDAFNFRGYRKWIESFIEDPAGRRGEGSGTAGELKRLLDESGTDLTKTYFMPDFDRPRRYSGELATLLRCYQSPLSRSGESFAAFLQRSYQEIQLLAATNGSNPSNVAARHLQVILRDKLGHPNVSMPETLRSSYLHELVGFLRDHLVKMARAGTEVDLLVTGGYKAYSLLAGKFVATQPEDRNWRALYIHEEQEGHLIVETKDAIEIDKVKVRDVSWSPRVGQPR